MSIIAFNVGVTGLVGSTINPRRNTMITTDNLATVTAAGYINNQNSLGSPILPTDIFEVFYGWTNAQSPGTFAIFTVSYSQATGFTLVLWENPGNVLLPVVSGDFAVFNGTSGQIKDSGSAPSAASQPYVVVSGGSITTGHLLEAKDANGTVEDSGISVASLSALITQTGNLSRTTLTMTAAQFIAAYATPAQVVAAPGAGKTIIPLMMTFGLTFGSAAFATSTGDGQLQWGATADGGGTLSVAGTIPTATITDTSSVAYAQGIIAAGNITAVSGLGLFWSNAAAAYTAGTGSTVTIDVVYITISNNN